MNFQETTTLCKAIAVIAPAQRLEPDTPAFWSVILADVNYADARKAIIAIGKRQQFISPSDIIAEVKALRAKRLEGVDRLAHLAETPAQWREIIAKVADGEMEVPPLAFEDPVAAQAIAAKVRDLFPRPPRPLPSDRDMPALPPAPTVDHATSEALEAERARQLAALAELDTTTREDTPA